MGGEARKSGCKGCGEEKEEEEEASPEPQTATSCFAALPAC